jgi:hypothetical protein
MLGTLVLLARAVVEAVTEAAVVDTPEAAPAVWTGARKPLRLVRGAGAFCGKVDD